jgi:hypothetical protein
VWITAFQAVEHKVIKPLLIDCLETMRIRMGVSELTTMNRIATPSSTTAATSIGDQIQTFRRAAEALVEENNHHHRSVGTKNSELRWIRQQLHYPTQMLRQGKHVNTSEMLEEWKNKLQRLKGL